MIKIFRNLSLKSLKESAREVFRRFPLSCLLTCLLTLWALIQVWDVIPSGAMVSHQRAILSYYLGSALLLSLVLEVWMEEFPSRTLSVTLKAVAHLLWMANALVMAFCFNEVDTEMASGMTAVTAFLAVEFLILPFYREKDDMASWNFGVRSAWWAVWSLLVSGLMLAGLVLLLNAVRELFGVHIPDRAFTTLCVLLLIFLPLLIWMGKIPSGKGKFNREPFSSAFLIKSVRYLLVPLLTLYLAVLYAYGLKGLLTWSLPNGWVSWLVTALMGGYILLSLVFYAVRKESLTRTDLWLVRYMPLLILPLVVMMSIGLLRRFMDYGVTANRLYMLTLNLWFYYVLFRMYHQKSRRISWVSLSLSALMVLVSAFPLNYHSISRDLLSSRVRKVLTEELRLTLPISLDEFKEALSSLPQDKARRLADECAYLADDARGKALKGVVTYSTYNPFSYLTRDMTGVTGREAMWYHWEAEPGVLSVPEGFARYMETDERWRVGDDSLKAEILDKEYVIERAQFDRLLGRIRDFMENGMNPLGEDEMMLRCTNGSLLLCRSLSFNDGSDTAFIKGHLFLK